MSSVPAVNSPFYERKFEIILVNGNNKEIFSSTNSLANKKPQVTFDSTGTATIGGGVTNTIIPVKDYSSLKCVFTIKKSVKLWQEGIITIYNLNPSNERDILFNATDVIINAGYVNGPYGQIFSGHIIQALRGKEDQVNYYVRLVCGDGDKVAPTAFCTGSVSSQQNYRNVLLTGCRTGINGKPINIQIDPMPTDNQNFTRAKVVFGMAKDYIRQYGLANNAATYTKDGVINIKNIDASPAQSGIYYNLNAESGMIGIPVQTDKGIEVKSLINPNFDLMSWVKLNNRDVQQFQVNYPDSTIPNLLDLDGLYRIIGINYTGDTRGNDWYMNMTTVSQTGNQTSLLQDPGSQTGF